jgi:hypothetical protein
MTRNTHVAVCAMLPLLAQSVLRGCLWRSRVKREANQELVFVGIKPQVSGWAVGVVFCSKQQSHIGDVLYDGCLCVLESQHMAPGRTWLASAHPEARHSCVGTSSSIWPHIVLLQC